MFHKFHGFTRKQVSDVSGLLVAGLQNIICLRGNCRYCMLRKLVRMLRKKMEKKYRKVSLWQVVLERLEFFFMGTARLECAESV